MNTPSRLNDIATASFAAIERMAHAACKDSLPKDGMFNEDQLDVMLGERMPTYRRIAEVMFAALFSTDSEVKR